MSSVHAPVSYTHLIAELEALPVAKEIEKVFYGELPIQIGYCKDVYKRQEGMLVKLTRIFVILFIVIAAVLNMSIF